MDPESGRTDPGIPEETGGLCEDSPASVEELAGAEQISSVEEIAGPIAIASVGVSI